MDGLLLPVHLHPTAVLQQALLHLSALLVELFQVFMVLLDQGSVCKISEEDHSLAEDELVLIEPRQEILKRLHDFLGKSWLIEVMPYQPFEPSIHNLVI